MPRITFIEANGKEHVVEAKAGQSVMQAAMDNLVPGILAECGGYANCATCHVYVAEPWLPKLPTADGTEQAMLDCAYHLQPNSRLSCQLKVTPALDGLVVRLPVSQTA